MTGHDLLFLSILNPACPEAKRDETGAFGDDYNYGCDLGEFVEDTIVVPITRAILPGSGRKLVVGEAAGSVGEVADSYENAHLTFMEIYERAFSSMSFPGPGREGADRKSLFQPFNSLPAEGPGSGGG